MISLLSLFECITRSSSLSSLEEIKLIITINFISSKDGHDEERVMHSKLITKKFD